MPWYVPCTQDGVNQARLTGLQLADLGAYVVEVVASFLNSCWHGPAIPEDWHLELVAAIHKKGPLDLCENYRPISLLNLGCPRGDYFYVYVFCSWLSTWHLTLVVG